MRKTSLQEYYLGSYVESVVKEQAEKVAGSSFKLTLIQFDVAKVQKRRFDNRLTPYLPVKLVQGLLLLLFQLLSNQNLFVVSLF